MTKNDLVSALKIQAKRDFEAAESLFTSKKYTYALFFCQLTIEKLLKALIVKKTNKIYPPIHDLIKLTEQAKLKTSVSKQAELQEIVSWNIKARYDTVKLEFYKKANKEFTKKWLQKVEKIIQWLKNQF